MGSWDEVGGQGVPPILAALLIAWHLSGKISHPNRRDKQCFPYAVLHALFQSQTSYLNYL